ncbi:MAG: hypothetical protein NTY77_19045 [Elusimicrobia bacterium]|nr:hypothetical protein [Elusimicrobiota bacterium]
MMTTAMLGLLAVAGPLCASPKATEPSREQVEAKITAIYAQMRELRAQSPFTEPEPRKALERIVAQPASCKGRSDDKYCRLYLEVLAKKSGLKPDDVFAAFTAEEIMRYKLLRTVTGSTGDIRVFHKLAQAAGLKDWRVGTVEKKSYAAGCYEGGAKLKRKKLDTPRNGHGAMAVRWGGKWRLLDTSAYDGPRYAQAGPEPLHELAVDKPEELLGREVYFGLPMDPYLATAVSESPDRAFTLKAVEKDMGSDCRFDAPPAP